MDLHDHDHHHHDHDHDHGVAVEERPMDAASQSLADALKLSFRILTVIMVFMVIGFLLSGFSVVKSDEIAVKTVLGKVVGTSDPGGGLTYTWPWPIGEIQKVQVRGIPEVELWDFWPAVPPGQDRMDLTKMKIDRQDLIPGFDGALFTADHNLIHAYIKFTYEIRNPKEYVKQIGAIKSDSELARKFPDVDPQTLNLQELLRSAVSQSAIAVAASRTADSVVLQDKGTFENSVRTLAQQKLSKALGAEDPQHESVFITSLVSNVGWPVAAQRAYQAAQNADAERVQKHQAAIGEAEGLLRKAAGANYTRLVRSPESDPQSPLPPEQDLIGQYTRARAELTQAQGYLDAQKASGQPVSAALAQRVTQLQGRAQELLGQIDAVLGGNEISGEAQAMIYGAATANAQYLGALKSRAGWFQQVVQGYQASPELQMKRLWADASDQILSSELVEKFIINPGTQRTVIEVNRDPDIVKGIANEQTRIDKKKAEDARMEAARKAAQAAPQRPEGE